MELILLKSKIHRAVLTATELHYEGSCAIDEDLLNSAGIIVGEQLHIWNINNGERFITYAITGERGSGTISLNGSAARRASIGDLLIIATFAHYTPEEAKKHQAKVVYVDSKNRETK